MSQVSKIDFLDQKFWFKIQDTNFSLKKFSKQQNTKKTLNLNENHKLGYKGLVLMTITLAPTLYKYSFWIHEKFCDKTIENSY